MSSLGVKGYTGHRPSAAGDTYSYEPGTSLDGREKRYMQLFHTIKRRSALGGEIDDRRSVQQTSTAGMKPQDFFPYATEVARRMPAEKPLVTGSTYGASFPDFQKEAKAVADMSDDDFERAFREVDIDGSGALDKGELSLLLRHLLGREPTDLQVKALQQLSDSNRDGRVTWPEIKGALPTIRDRIVRTARVTYGKAGQPTLRLPMAPEVVAGGPMVSAAGRDVGPLGRVPARMPLRDPKTGGMASTTTDLAEGTSKGTRHIPGYAGYIAANAGKSVAGSHSFGGSARDTFHSKNNMGEAHTVRMKGYTGYMPKGHAIPADVDKPRGQFAATDTAAADSLVEAYWAARAKVAASKAAAGGGS